MTLKPVSTGCESCNVDETVEYLMSPIVFSRLEGLMGVTRRKCAWYQTRISYPSLELSWDAPGCSGGLGSGLRGWETGKHRTGYSEVLRVEEDFTRGLYSFFRAVNED